MQRTKESIRGHRQRLVEKDAAEEGAKKLLDEPTAEPRVGQNLRRGADYGEMLREFGADPMGGIITDA